MKLGILIFMFLNIGMCVSKEERVICINHVWGGGDGGRSILIGINNKDLSKTEDDLKLEKIFTDKYVVDKKMFETIERFISQNCDSLNIINEYSNEFFIIRIITNGSTHNCYLENKKLSKPYFQRLLKTLNVMPGTSEGDRLKTHFKRIIIGLN